jgi:hypothetical protein
VNYEETTTVRVQRAADVAVGVSTPGEGKWLLPGNEEKAHEKVEVPDSNPPLTEGRKFAQVERMVSGRVHIECPSCKGAEEGSLVESEKVTLDGGPDDVIRWSPDGSLGMRQSYKAEFKCHRGRGDCPREAMSFWLQTPKENVTEIRYKKVVATSHGERGGAWMGAVMGSLFFLGGIALVGGISASNGKFTPATMMFGVPFVGIGGFFATAGILGITAKDSDTQVYSKAP